MSSGIMFTSREMRYIALFENITGATVKDCIIDDERDQIVFLVKEGDMGLAIGRNGRNIHQLENMIRKRPEIIEYSEDPVNFIKNAFRPAQVKEIRITERQNGKKFAIVNINPRDKGTAIGKNGRKAERTRFLAKRYFQIENVSIV
jgi:N utilization substance protein A